jgi:predicted permease
MLTAMLPVLAVTSPFFALVFCAWAAAQRRLLPESAIPGLNGFGLIFAPPRLLFRFGRDTPLPELAAPRLLGKDAAGPVISTLLVDLLLSSSLCLALTQAIGMLGQAASPVALVTIGAVIAVSGRHAAGPTPLRRFLPVALTLTAALPGASNVSLLAERHGADKGRIARIILASTALAFLSFSGWARHLVGTA